MLSAKDVVKAHKVLSGVVVNTPLEYDHYLSEKYGAKIYLKKENAQRVRSFKNSWSLLCHFTVDKRRTWGVVWSVHRRGITLKVSHTLVTR